MFNKVEKSVSIIKTDMESIKMTQINFKRLKNTVSEMKNIQCLDGIKSRADYTKQTKRVMNLKIQ